MRVFTVHPAHKNGVFAIAVARAGLWRAEPGRVQTATRRLPVSCVKACPRFEPTRGSGVRRIELQTVMVGGIFVPRWVRFHVQRRGHSVSPKKVTLISFLVFDNRDRAVKFTSIDGAAMKCVRQSDGNTLLDPMDAKLTRMVCHDDNPVAVSRK